MREIFVGPNDSGQRVDRFLKKYFEKANLSFIYKNLRKKNIVVNGKKVKPEDELKEGDLIKLFLSEETIEKFKREPVNLKSKKFPKVIYEDDNVILIEKKAGTLSHNASSEFEMNSVDSMIDYLIAKGDFNPRLENSFRPAVVNRLDRNTSGILIGAKNAMALRDLNKSIKENNIEKYYVAMVKGNVKKDFRDISYLSKNEDKNKVYVNKNKVDGSKESITEFKVLKHSEFYSLLSVNLITGRTHQIRTILNSYKFPIVGDRKYGNHRVNDYFENTYSYDSQFLHNYKVRFKDLSENLSYLNGKEFYCNLPTLEKSIVTDIFGDIKLEEL